MTKTDTNTNPNIKVTWCLGDLKRICQIQLKTKNENTTKPHNANEKQTTQIQLKTYKTNKTKKMF